ncbi:MAG: exo-beta-N-acetylmuramidase NamZ family protein [Phocaeicola sp.]
MKTTYLFLLFLGLFLQPLLHPVAAQELPQMGAEQLERYLPLLKNKRVALVVNHTSVVGKEQTHLLDTLLALGVEVKTLFAPEHGFRGTADAGETISHGKDSRTGIPIASLYGKTKKPTAQQLAQVDLVLFDMQDVGARFYTYISTMHYVMEACAEQGKELIVTDRPNPCDYIDGPIRRSELKTFVSMHPIPVLHGCTVGELAQMINGEGWLQGGKKCPLTVIPVNGWKHGDPYSLPVKPSPNLPNDHAIALYPSLCPFEGTGMSMGRGTHFPFEVIGSPDLPKGSFSFTPQPLEGFDKNPLHKGRICHGSDLRKVEAPQGLSLKYVIEYYQAYKQAGKADKFFTRPKWFDILLGTPKVRELIIAGKNEEEIRALWKEELARYKKMREGYLIYK